MRDERACASTCERRLLNVWDGEPRGRQAVKLLTTGEGWRVGFGGGGGGEVRWGNSQCDTEGATSPPGDTLAPGYSDLSFFVVLWCPFAFCFTAVFGKTAGMFVNSWTTNVRPR